MPATVVRVPLVAAAVCPHPPLIVPEIAAGAAPELDDLRAACAAALARLAAAGARTVVVVGADAEERDYRPPFRGSFRPWGLPLDVTLGPRPARPLDVAAGAPDVAAGTPDGQPGPLDVAAGAPPAPLPLSLTVGAWLLDRAFPPATPVTYRMTTVRPDAAPAECAERGRRLGGDEPWALLVMGDGSACRGEKSPGYDDPRAAAYDDGVAAALAAADPAALRDLDPATSAELRVAGRAPWQVLAGAVQAAGGDWRGDLSYYAAPYGVAYFVAVWTPGR